MQRKRQPEGFVVEDIYGIGQRDNPVGFIRRRRFVRGTRTYTGVGEDLPRDDGGLARSPGTWNYASGDAETKWKQFLEEVRQGEKTGK